MPADQKQKGKRRRVADFMNPDVVCVAPDMTLGEASALLAKRGVGGAPVVDADGHVVGVVSQSDLIRQAGRRVTVAESGRFFTDDDDLQDLGATRTDPRDTRIAELMSTEVHTVGRNDSLALAANVMRERRIHRLLVTERGRLVGMLSSLDLLRVVEEVG